MGTDQVILARAPADAGKPRWRQPLTGLAGGLLISALLVGAIAFAVTRPSTYDDPRAMIRIVRDTGFVCTPGPKYLVMYDADSALRACFLDGLERDRNVLGFYTYDDPALVESEVRVVRDMGFTGVNEGRVWIVGENWIVNAPRAAVSPAELRRMAEALGGDIVGP